MSKASYIEHHFKWQGVTITVRHCPNWLSTVDEVQHIEVISSGREPLPITQTGYL